MIVDRLDNMIVDRHDDKIVDSRDVRDQFLHVEIGINI